MKAPCSRCVPSRIVPLVLVVVVCVAAAGCSQGMPINHPAATPQPSSAIASPTPSGSPLPTTIAEVYQRATQALDRPGMLYHATIQRDAQTAGVQDPQGLGTSTTEVWVDARRNLARTETRRVRDGWITIATTQGQYTLTQPNGDLTKSAPLLCPARSLATAIVLGCPDAPFQTYTFPTPGGAPQQQTATPTITVAAGQDPTRPTIVVTAVKQQQPYREAALTQTRRLSLDAATCLPLTEEIVQVSNSRSEERATYAYGFVPESSVSADFFDPLALRDLRPDPQGALDQPPPGFTIYWLGARFTAAGVPPLELWRVSRYNPADHPWDADQITLDYTPADDAFAGEPVVRLTEYTRTTWETAPGIARTPDGPCWTQETIALSQGQATIFLGYTWPGNVPPAPDACPTDRPTDRFLAQVTIGETVVVVAPWQWPTQTRAGIETVVRALTPRT